MLSAETQERPLPRGASRRTLDAGRFELISRIASDLAHEINNPLHASIINLEVLRKRVARGRTDEADERADVIEAEIRRVHLMVDQLLRLLRPDPDTGDGVDPEEAVRDIVPLIELRARIARVGFSYQALPCAQRLRIGRDDLRFAVLHLAEPLLDTLRAADGDLEMSVEEADRSVRIRVIARLRAEAVGVDAAAEAGTPGQASHLAPPTSNLPSPDSGEGSGEKGGVRGALGEGSGEKSDPATPSEPRAPGTGTSLAWDRCGAAVEAVTELVRDAGGQVMRAGDTSSVAELVLLLPGIDRA